MKEQEQEGPKPHILEEGGRGGGVRGGREDSGNQDKRERFNSLAGTVGGAAGGLEGRWRVAAAGAKWRSSRTSFPLSPSACWCRRPALPLRLRWLCSPLCHAVGVLALGEGGAAPEPLCSPALCLELVLEESEARGERQEEEAEEEEGQGK